LSGTVTTVIPTFRRPRLLRRAIASVLSQTYRDCIVAVFDNASADETEQVVAESAARDPRVRYVRRAVHVDGLTNFLDAMAHVESEFFSLLSDDDVIFPEFFASGVAALAEHPQAMFFAGSTLEFDDAGTLRYAPSTYWPREGLYQPAESVPLMLNNRHLTWTGILFRRSLIDSIGLIDPLTGPGADFDYELRAAVRFPIVVSFKPCAAWIFHAASHSGRETAAVIPGYERMIHNAAAANAVPEPLRRRAIEGVERQLRVKLLEISVKALVRGDAGASREAAVTMRDKYGAWMLGWALVVVNALCSRIALLRAVLTWLESMRLRLRAARSERGLHAQHVEVERYAAYLKLP